MTSPVPFNICALVLAAGWSRRMGQPKQLLRYHGLTLTGCVVTTLLNVPVDRVVVVTRSELLPHIELPEDPRITTTVNDDPCSEMIDSVRLGVHACIGTGTSSNGTDCPCDAILVMPGDMPRVSLNTYRDCISQFQQARRRLVVATYAGRRGHPLIIPDYLIPEIHTYTKGLNTLLDAHRDRIALVATDDPGVTDILNTPEDYKRLLSEGE